MEGEGHCGYDDRDYLSGRRRICKLDACHGEKVKKAGPSKAMVAKTGKEKYVSLEVVVWICNAMGCEIYDVIELHQASDTSASSDS